jgi:glyoxylase-like metal-dependent hydrolase (beta-lactamase superfamily II)
MKISFLIRGKMVILQTMITIREFTFNPFAEHTYVLWDDHGQAVIIDPGCYEKHEEQELADFISGHKLSVSALWNTHGHIDHVLGNAFVQQQYKVPFFVHALDVPTMRAVKTYASNYGFPKYTEATVDGHLEEGSPVYIGSTPLAVLFLPGHAPGHIGFYQPEEKFLIGGDVLFYHSIGRTDLPGGNHQTLIQSIQQQLFPLPDEVTVYPGHGPTTTLGEEKINNPYCALAIR